MTVGPDILELVRYDRSLSRETRLRKTRIPAKHVDRDWDAYEVRPATEDAREYLIDWAKTFGEEPVMHNGQGVALIGPPGVGKTLAACLTALDLFEHRYVVRFTTLTGYLETMQRQMTLESIWQRGYDESAFSEWAENDRWLHEVRSVAHLVVLDDVGKEHHSASGWARNVFDQFLRDRVNLGRPVIVTSNVRVQDWAVEYSEAMQDFIHEACRVFTVREYDSRRAR